MRGNCWLRCHVYMISKPLTLDMSPSRKGMRPFHYSIMLWHVMLLPNYFFNVMQRAK